MVPPVDFERLARENMNRLYAHAAVLLRSSADAEDAAEEAVYQLLRRKKPFDSDEHGRAWLVRVTINASLKMLRHRKNFTESPDDLDKLTADFKFPEQTELFEAVSQLDPKYKSVILLYYYEDMSVAETAKALKITRSAVTTRLARAREMLKKALEGRNYHG